MNVLEVARDAYDITIVDTSPFFYGAMLATLEPTDELLLLCGHDVPTLKNVRLSVNTLELLQAEELGSPLGQTLRIQADDARKRRQDAAEERAMKVPVKMMFPTALFIFPAMFIVILGPALLSLTDFF